MPTAKQKQALRQLPAVEELLHHAAVEALSRVLPREIVVDLVRSVVDDARDAILRGERADSAPDDLANEILRKALKLEKPSLKRAINATGVIIHTNLGRSVLAEPAVRAVEEVARGYSTLEYDCAHMARGSRHEHYEQMICTLTGAEAALAVNNNAAAVMMTLAEFGAGQEAIISRGELVEIGGSFRVPDIMALSDAHMVEVGTTNKTHLADYERAVSERTSLLLKVHPSNFRMTGFTEAVSVKQLRSLANQINEQRNAEAAADASGMRRRVRHVLVFEDLGSGALVDLGGDLHETTVHEALAQGADLVSFSCDKLLGGPQAGVIVGKKDYIDRLKASPYARVLRLDKMSIAALEATLRLYLDETVARELVPTLRMLTEAPERVRERAQQLKDAIEASVAADDLELNLDPDIARAGGGALPMCDIPTYVVRATFGRGSAQDCERYLATQRRVPVIARIHDGCVLFDARTILAGESDEIAHALADYFGQLP